MFRSRLLIAVVRVRRKKKTNVLNGLLITRVIHKFLFVLPQSYIEGSPHPLLICSAQSNRLRKKKTILCIFLFLVNNNSKVEMT